MAEQEFKGIFSSSLYILCIFFNETCAYVLPQCSSPKPRYYYLPAIGGCDNSKHSNCAIYHDKQMNEGENNEPVRLSLKTQRQCLTA